MNSLFSLVSKLTIQKLLSLFGIMVLLSAGFLVKIFDFRFLCFFIAFLLFVNLFSLKWYEVDEDGFVDFQTLVEKTLEFSYTEILYFLNTHPEIEELIVIEKEDSGRLKILERDIEKFFKLLKQSKRRVDIIV